MKYLGSSRAATHPARTDLIPNLVSITTVRKAGEMPGYMPSHFMLVIARSLQ